MFKQKHPVKIVKTSIKVMHFFLWLDEVRQLVLVVRGDIERDLRAKVEMLKSPYTVILKFTPERRRGAISQNLRHQSTYSDQYPDSLHTCRACPTIFENDVIVTYFPSRSICQWK